MRQRIFPEFCFLFFCDSGSPSFFPSLTQPLFFPLSPLPLTLYLEERKAHTTSNKAQVRTKVLPRQRRVSTTAAGRQC